VTVPAYSDIGGALSAYTIGGFANQNAQSTFSLNVRDYVTPRTEISTPGMLQVNGGTPGSSCPTVYPAGSICADGMVYMGSALAASTLFWVDGNRTDTYTQTGSYTQPFKKMSTAIAAMMGSGPYVLYVYPTPTGYTDTGALVGPAATITVYGNGATWTVTGSLTLPGVLHSYDMTTQTTGGIVSTQTGTVRSTIHGGSIIGNLTTSGYVHFHDSTISTGVITVGSGSFVYMSGVVGGSRIVTTDATSIFSAIGINLDSSTASALIDASAGGQLIITSSLLKNTGATTVNCADGAATPATANMFNGVISSGAISCGAALTTFANVSPRPSGSAVFAISNPADICVSASGSQTTYTCTSTSVSTSLVTGMRVLWVPDQTNSGTTPTLNINTLGAKTIVHQNGTALVVGEFTVGAPVDLYYDGTNWKTEWRFGLTSAGIPSFAAGGSANHAVCWKADGKTLGYCSVVVDASGVCGTCN
jgi:hypothetical protein